MKTDSPVKIWRKQKKTHEFLGKTGRVISWTKIHTPPARFANEAPYYVILVRMRKGGLRLGQLVDYERKEIKRGMEVKLVYRRLGRADEEGVINYGLKFKPI